MPARAGEAHKAFLASLEMIFDQPGIFIRGKQPPALDFVLRMVKD